MGKGAVTATPMKEDDKKPAEDGPVRRPTFFKSGPKKDETKEDTGFINRSAMNQKKEDDKKDQAPSQQPSRDTGFRKGPAEGGASATGGPAWRSTGG